MEMVKAIVMQIEVLVLCVGVFIQTCRLCARAKHKDASTNTPSVLCNECNADCVKEFKSRVQEFLKTKSFSITQHEWLLKYRAPICPTGPNKEPLKWGVDYKKWYYTDSKTKTHVLVECKASKK